MEHGWKYKSLQIDYQVHLFSFLLYYLSWRYIKMSPDHWAAPTAQGPFLFLTSWSTAEKHRWFCLLTVQLHWEYSRHRVHNTLEVSSLVPHPESIPYTEDKLMFQFLFHFIAITNLICGVLGVLFYIRICGKHTRRRWPCFSRVDGRVFLMPAGRPHCRGLVCCDLVWCVRYPYKIELWLFRAEENLIRYMDWCGDADKPPHRSSKMQQ